MTAGPAALIHVEMIMVRCVVIGAEHEAEPCAGAVAHVAQECAFVCFAVPIAA